jgi:hypothetical protein
MTTTSVCSRSVICGLLLDGYTGSGRNRLILSRTAGLRRPDKYARGRGRHVENFAGFERVRASGYPRFISCSYRCCICGDSGTNPCCSWPDSRSRASSDRSNRLWRLLARSTLSSDAPRLRNNLEGSSYRPSGFPAVCTGPSSGMAGNSCRGRGSAPECRVLTHR